MKTTLHSSVIFVVLLGMGLISCPAQTSSAGGSVKSPAADKFDVAIIYTYKVAKISNLSGSTFGLKGAAVDGVYWLGDKVKNLGVAFDINGETASNIKPGVNLSQFTLAAGPRYTLWKGTPKSHPANLFGQALGGYVHAFNGVFPTSSGPAAGANSFSLQLGGGFNLSPRKSLDLRLIQADYILSKLPNANNDLQNDLRLSMGVVFRPGAMFHRR